MGQLSNSERFQRHHDPNLIKNQMYKESTVFLGALFHALWKTSRQLNYQHRTFAIGAERGGMS